MNSATHLEGFSAAQAAVARGDLPRAKQLLQALIERSPLQLDAFHLLAVLERRLGNYDASRAYFRRLLAARPNDPYIHNNFANCLRDAQELDAAIEHYQYALALQPGYLDASLNLGLTLKAAGRPTEAAHVFKGAVERTPKSAKAWQCLGSVQRDLGAYDEAAAAFEQALALDPENAQLRHARALLEAERGRPAVALYARAAEVAPDDPEIALGHAIAKYESGASDEAVAMLADVTSKHPDWVKGHAALAQIRWQLGDTEDFARSFEQAIARRPGDLELQVGYFGTLMRAGQYRAVLERLAFARTAFDAADLFDRYEAVCASEVGDSARAEAAFKRQRDTPDIGLQVARLRHLLRSRRADDAATLGERLVTGPGAHEVWPYLGLAWRLLDDPRAQWLERQEFVAQFEFPELRAKLARLVEVLRSIHHARIHPFDQSLRGGTQTDGHLFRRHEPELVELRECIERGVAQYIERLPIEAEHPFLARRGARAEFVGSYSVRLRANGYHINHMHPDAWISCCFYVDTPSSIGTHADDPAGWLTIGRPPAELALDLPPLTQVRPEPARLVVFPSFMWHGTAPFASGERLTVVSDFQAVVPR